MLSLGPSKHIGSHRCLLRLKRLDANRPRRPRQSTKDFIFGNPACATMDENSPITGIGALARKVALEQAINLSDSQAHEIWHALQLIDTNEWLKGRPVAVVQLAMDFHAFPSTWKVIADKGTRAEGVGARGGCDRSGVCATAAIARGDGGSCRRRTSPCVAR